MPEYGFEEIFQREMLLLGREAVQKLRCAHVLVCGLGGVGAYAVEALARTGVSSLSLLDFDTISPSNINRQLPALLSTVGKSKAALLLHRVRDINPHCQAHAVEKKLLQENIPVIMAELPKPDFIVDAIDDVPAKLGLILYAKKNGIDIISAMGAGQKLRPELLRIADISQTEGCPLAKKMRFELKKLGISKGLTVVYSSEAPPLTAIMGKNEVEGKRAFGSISYMPAMAGLLLASYVIRRLIGAAD